jgi:hypothetical protein
MSDRLEFRPRENGEFDEIVARFGDGMVHVETMSGTSCYVGFYWNDGLVCQWYINSARKLTYYHEVSRSVATPPDTQGAGYGGLPAQVYSDEEGGLPREFLEFAKFIENNPPMEKREVSVRMIQAVAAAIQTLTAENERWKRQSDDWQTRGWELGKECDKQAARIAELEAEVAAAREVIEWYGEQARLARLIHSEGDAGRNALAADGGKHARAFLARNTDGGGK